MSIRVSDRLQKVAPSVTMAITAKAMAMRAEGIDVLSFSAGEPDFDTPTHIKDAARGGLDRGVAKYTAVAGLPSLRAAVATELNRVHNTDFAREQVLVSSGAKHSLYNAFMATLNEGDEVVIFSPYWVSYPEMVKLAGGVPVIVETTAEDGFVPDIDRVKAALTPRTRAIVLNTPCNPTGAVYPRAALEALATLACERDLFVLSDDIYRNLVYGSAEYTSIASLSRDIASRTIVIDGVSKTYAMTGWRIGFAAGPVDLIKAMSKIQSQSTSGACHIAQVAAEAAISGAQDCVTTMRGAFDTRRQEIVKLLNDIPDVVCREPDGAFYVFPDLRAFVGRTTPRGEKVAGDVELCAYILEAGRAALVPGSGFGCPGFARLSYACSNDDIQTGIGRISDCLSQLS